MLVKGMNERLRSQLRDSVAESSLHDSLKLRRYEIIPPWLRRGVAGWEEEHGV